LISRNPPHDDIKDALSSAIEISVKPSANGINRRDTSNIVYSKRFGGISHGW
jgi:hypothetical protein